MAGKRTGKFGRALNVTKKKKKKKKKRRRRRRKKKRKEAKEEKKMGTVTWLSLDIAVTDFLTWRVVTGIPRQRN